MVAQGPPHTNSHVRVAWDTIVILNFFAGVVPGDGRNDDDELAHGHDEGNDPAEAKEHAVEHPLGFAGPHNRLGLSGSVVGLNLTDRGKADKTSEEHE